MKNIILFASGSGTNAENIARKLDGTGNIRVAALFCNNPKAGVIGRMEQLGVPVHLFSREVFADKEAFMALLRPYQPDLIVLAGFLWLVPAYLIEHFPGKILNIHPALLPRHGGKGMYGQHVHRAVLAAKDKEHGITIHLVNEKYDEGTPVFQARFNVEKGETLASVSEKIAQLEMLYFPEAIRRVLG